MNNNMQVGKRLGEKVVIINKKRLIGCWISQSVMILQYIEGWSYPSKKLNLSRS
jgi:hypothetical protein